MGKGTGGGGYVSPNIDTFERATANTIFNRLGANPAYQSYSYNPGTNPYGAGSGRSATTGRALPGVGSSNRSSGTQALNRSSDIPMQGNGGNSYIPDLGTLQGGASKAKGKEDPYANYDFSQTGLPIEGEQGVRYSTRGYDLSPFDEAIAGYRNPARLTQTYSGASYDPYQFNFGQLPEEYSQRAYQAGAKDINKAGRDKLTQIQETIGTRRPGLLKKASEESARGTNKNLLDLNNQVQLEKMRQNLDLGKLQQIQQAGENLNAANFNAGEGYRGYQSRSDLEKSNADSAFKNLQALSQTGGAKVGAQSGLVGSEREYQDKALQYLMGLYGTATGQANQAAALANQRNQSAFGNLLGLGGLGAGIASLFTGGAAAPLAAGLGGGFNLGNFAGLLAI